MAKKDYKRDTERIAKRFILLFPPITNIEILLFVIKRLLNDFILFTLIKCNVHRNFQGKGVKDN